MSPSAHCDAHRLIQAVVKALSCSTATTYLPCKLVTVLAVAWFIRYANGNDAVTADLGRVAVRRVTAQRICHFESPTSHQTRLAFLRATCTLRRACAKAAFLFPIRLHPPFRSLRPSSYPRMGARKDRTLFRRPHSHSLERRDRGEVSRLCVLALDF
jgi:hypothetical protein